MNLCAYAWRNLLGRPVRSMLTASAVALGIAAVVALASIAWGFEASWQKANDARGTDLVVTRLSSENTLPSPFEAEPGLRLLARQPRVQAVAGLLSEMLSVGEGAPPVFVFGWAWGSYLWGHLRLTAGRWPASDGEPAAVLGTLAAATLHRHVGDVIDLEGHAFRVVGLYESPALVENGAVLVTLTQAQRVMDKPGKVNVLNLRLDPAAGEADLRAIRDQVAASMPGFIAFTSGELVGRNAIVRIAKAMAGATVLVAVLVGALVVFNSMWMAVHERTREIGLLKALGWRPATIARLLVGEAVLLSLAGGIGGVLLGVAGTLGLERMELLRGKLEPLFEPAWLPAVLGLSVLVGLAGGLVPALRAVSGAPARALRQE